MKNPDILVSPRVPPWFWKLEGHTIVEMTRPEKLERLELLGETGKQPITFSEIYPWIKKKAIWSCLGAVLLIILTVYISKHVRLS